MIHRKYFQDGFTQFGASCSKRQPYLRRRELQTGFTLIEVLIVIAITGTISTFLLLNLGTSRVNLPAAAEQLIAEIRDVQSQAMGSSRQGGLLRCGFGITPDTVNRGGYYSYWGPNASTTDCLQINHNFSSLEDTKYARMEFSDQNFEFKNDSAGVIFKDVFFVPPDPKTFIDNSDDLNAPPARLLFGIRGKTCRTTKECRAVCIYPSGLIRIATGLTCQP